MKKRTRITKPGQSPIPVFLHLSKVQKSNRYPFLTFLKTIFPLYYIHTHDVKQKKSNEEKGHMNRMITIKNKSRTITSGTIILTCVILFLLLASKVMKSKDMLHIDTIIVSSFEKIKGIFPSELMLVITTIGSIKWLGASVIFLACGLLFVKRDYGATMFILLVPLGGGFINRLLKHLYARERPSIVQYVDGTGYSFPSGHATGSMVLYGCLIYLVVRGTLTLKVKWVLAIIFSILLLFIGLSRIYFNVHYPSDVLGGYLLGFAWILLCILVFELLLKLEVKRKITNL